MAIACQVATVGVVGFGYAISSPAKNHYIPSPVTLAFTVLKTLQCLFEMVPLLPIVSIKIVIR